MIIQRKIYRKNYDCLAVGERLRLKRTLLGLTQEEMAKRINHTPKCYADIEKDCCEMPVETLMAIFASLNMLLDYNIYSHEQTLHVVQ